MIVRTDSFKYISVLKLQDFCCYFKYALLQHWTDMGVISLPFQMASL